MEHQLDKTFNLPNRLGFHYFPDVDHYSQKHLKEWLPILQQMKIGWLVLNSPLTHAISEDFVRPLVDSGIKLIVDFRQPLTQEPEWYTLEVLLSAYGKWGVSHAILDRNANMRESWGSSRWGNPDLIKGYADQFLKFAGLALDNTIYPVLGPLVPGGDYWDSAFIKILLLKIKDSASAVIRNNLSFSTYGWTFNRSLDWGSGGPSVWSDSGAYQIPTENQQNQQGFRAYEWVDAAVRTVFGRSLPVMLLETGISSSIENFTEVFHELGDQINIAGLINGRNVYIRENPNHLLSPLPSYIKSANFFVLSSSNPDHRSFCWFNENGQRLSAAQAFYIRERLLDSDSVRESPQTIPPSGVSHEFSYQRYILISQELLLSVTDLLDSLHLLLEREKPMVGFSPEDASRAASIIFITNDFGPEPDLMQSLRSNGSLVSIIQPQKIPAFLKENNYENT